MKADNNHAEEKNPRLEEDICIHIFTVSSAMVGVCLTVIGLIRVVVTLGKADTLADDLLAIDALLFLTSCLLSYTAMRSRNLRRMHRIEHLADFIFIVAMVFMAIICVFITFAISLNPVPAHA
jgi:ABC-type Na+ efflux pump permease subunit